MALSPVAIELEKLIYRRTHKEAGNFYRYWFIYVP